MAGEPAEGRVAARRAHERLLDPAEQIETVAVFVVEDLADLVLWWCACRWVCRYQIPSLSRAA